MRHEEEDGVDGEIGDCRADGVLEVVGGIHDCHARFCFILVEPWFEVLSLRVVFDRL